MTRRVIDGLIAQQQLGRDRAAPRSCAETHANARMCRYRPLRHRKSHGTHPVPRPGARAE